MSEPYAGMELRKDAAGLGHPAGKVKNVSYTEDMLILVSLFSSWSLTVSGQSGYKHHL